MGGNMIRAISGLFAIFLFGNVSGAFLGARFQEERHEKRDKVDHLEFNIMWHLKVKLGLKPRQIDKIDPLVKNACHEIRAVYTQGAEDIEKIIRKYHELIAGELTPDQDRIFKKLEAERRRKNDLLVDGLNP